MEVIGESSEILGFICGGWVFTLGNQTIAGVVEIINIGWTFTLVGIANQFLSSVVHQQTQKPNGLMRFPGANTNNTSMASTMVSFRAKWISQPSTVGWSLEKKTTANFPFYCGAVTALKLLSVGLFRNPQLNFHPKKHAWKVEEHGLPAPFRFHVLERVYS